MKYQVTEVALRYFIGLAVASGNAWLLFVTYLTYTSKGAGKAQADFEMAFELFRFGLPVLLISSVALVLISITQKDRGLFSNPWFIYYAVSAVIPILLFVF